jgi:hypothetical protein
MNDKNNNKLLSRIYILLLIFFKAIIFYTIIMVYHKNHFNIEIIPYFSVIKKRSINIIHIMTI